MSYEPEDCPKCGKTVYVTCFDEEEFRCQCFDCYPVEDDDFHGMGTERHALEAVCRWNVSVRFHQYTSGA